jgi:DNA polymerase III epsilon subunit-like protein
MEAETEVKRKVRYLVADTETCGVGENKISCEVALREICPVTLNTLQEWESLIDPEREIPQVVIDIHGITNEMVVDAPTMAEFIEHVLAGEFDGDDLVLICHNAPFDVPLLVNIGTVIGSVCTLFWSRQLIKDSLNHKLPTLRAHFGFPENEAHRALADVATTHRLLKELLVRTNRSLEQFASTQECTVHTMPWGKCKGQLIVTLPVSYLEWLWGLEELESNLRESVKKALKLQGITVKTVKEKK